MKYIRTDFENLIIIKHNIYKDKRGYFKENFRTGELEEIINAKLTFCQKNTVKSNLNVLRGLHFQRKPKAQSKLISVSVGKILDVAVDIRKESNTYGRYFSYILSAENHESLFIPKGFAHGYLTLSDLAIVNYHVDNYYDPDSESGISFDDNFLKINWGVDFDKLIVSEKDRNQNKFKW